MLIADWIALGLILLFALLGLLIGFGRGLRFFTKGFFGFLISILICYFIGGIIIKISFINDLLVKFRGLFENKQEWYYQLLLTIRIDIIVYYFALFIVVQILRLIIVSIISRIFESRNVVLNIINRFFGIALFLCMLLFFTMIAFQIILLIGGDIEAKFLTYITGSKLQLYTLYTKNPLTEIIELLFRIEIRIPVEVT